VTRRISRRVQDLVLMFVRYINGQFQSFCLRGLLKKVAPMMFRSRSRSSRMLSWWHVYDTARRGMPTPDANPSCHLRSGTLGYGCRQAGLRRRFLAKSWILKLRNRARPRKHSLRNSYISWSRKSLSIVVAIFLITQCRGRPCLRIFVSSTMCAPVVSFPGQGCCSETPSKGTGLEIANGGAATAKERNAASLTDTR
jgi:hypothetical protein